MTTYLRFCGLNVIDVKELVALEYLDFEGKYKNYTERHDFCELCFVERGEVEIKIENDTVILSNGEIAFIAPDMLHSYSSKSGNRSRAFVICFACPSPTLRMLSGIKFSHDDAHSFCIQRVIEESKTSFKMNDKELLEELPTAKFGAYQNILLLTEYLLICLRRVQLLHL